MSPYISAKIFWGLSYTCFLGTWALKQFEEEGAQIPHGKKKKKSNTNTSAPYFTSDETLQ